MTDKAEIRAAWADSFLGSLPPALTDKLLEGTRIETVKSRLLIVRGMQPPAGVWLVVTGLVRVFMRSEDGRQTTARYAGGSEFVGLTALLAGGIHMDVEALVDVRAVRIPPERMRSLAMREPVLTWSIACFLAQQMASSTETLGANIFLPVRARIARHLLDLAERDLDGYVVQVSQQHLANSIGSVREVVARDLKVLAQQGLIHRVGRTLRLIDLASLHEIATGHG